MWPFQNTDVYFCETAQQYFAPLAKDCGASLRTVEPMIFGFRTQFAVLTIGAYPGHFRSLCVKLRPSGKEDTVCVKDGVDIDLGHIERFVTGRMSEVYSERQQWAKEPIRKEVESLARIVREVAMPFITTPSADWDGVRAMIAERVSKMYDEKPWLKKYENGA